MLRTSYKNAELAQSPMLPSLNINFVYPCFKIRLDLENTSDNLGAVQTLCYCCTELNSGIKFVKSMAEAERLNQTFELSSASN